MYLCNMVKTKQEKLDLVVSILGPKIPKDTLDVLLENLNKKEVDGELSKISGEELAQIIKEEWNLLNYTKNSLKWLKVCELVKNTSNDMELGKAIRNLCNYI